MKVIDILNKIANREEIPKKVKYNDEFYKLNNYNNKYYRDNTEIDLLREHRHIESFFNDEIEIIEDTPKKIEKINWELTKETINPVSDSNTVKITALMKRTEKLKKTLNEIIDYINNMEK